MTDTVPVLYVRPREGSRVTPEQLHRNLSEHGAAGLGLTGQGAPYKFDDGTYEIRTFGPASAGCARDVLRHDGWAVAREGTMPADLLAVFLTGTNPTPNDA